MVCPPTSPGLSPRPRPAEPRRWRALATVWLALAVPGFAQINPLAPEKAFRFSARALNPQTIEARFLIADGYYLYRDKIRFAVEPTVAGLTVPPLPSGKVKDDQFFGRVETYRGSLIVNLALKDTAPGQKVVIEAESQGCADIGICYPPQVQRVIVPLPAANAAPTRVDELPRKTWLD